MNFTNKASNGMNNLKNKDRSDAGRRALPFVIEFVKFSTGFVALVALALITLRFAGAAQ